MRGVYKVAGRYLTRKDIDTVTYCFGGYVNEVCAEGAIKEAISMKRDVDTFTKEMATTIAKKWRTIDRDMSSKPQTPAGVFARQCGYSVRRFKDGVLFSCGVYYKLEDAIRVNDKVSEMFDTGEYDPKTLAKEMRDKYSQTTNNISSISRRRIGKNLVNGRIKQAIAIKQLKSGVRYVANLRHLGVIVYCGCWKTRQDAITVQIKIKRYLKRIPDPEKVDMDIVRMIRRDHKENELPIHLRFENIITPVDGCDDDVCVKVGENDIILEKSALPILIEYGSTIRTKGKARLVIGYSNKSVFMVLFGRQRNSLKMLNGNPFDLRRANIAPKTRDNKNLYGQNQHNSKDSAAILKHYSRVQKK